MGETPCGVWEPDSVSNGWHISESSASDPGKLAPRSPFLCLNFSNQIGLLTFVTQSELPTVVANTRALSRIMSLLSGNP